MKKTLHLKSYIFRPPVSNWVNYKKVINSSVVELVSVATFWFRVWGNAKKFPLLNCLSQLLLGTREDIKSYQIGAQNWIIVATILGTSRRWRWKRVFHRQSRVSGWRCATGEVEICSQICSWDGFILKSSVIWDTMCHCRCPRYNENSKLCDRFTSGKSPALSFVTCCNY